MKSVIFEHRFMIFTILLYSRLNNGILNSKENGLNIMMANRVKSRR